MRLSPRGQVFYKHSAPRSMLCLAPPPMTTPESNNPFPVDDTTRRNRKTTTAHPGNAAVKHARSQTAGRRTDMSRTQ